jgi:hypothetical protein
MISPWRRTRSPTAHYIVAIRLDPLQRGHVLGFPVELRELAVSVEDRDGLLDALT